MNKYENSKIYKLSCDNYDKIYVGSTIQPLEERLKDHLNDYNRFKNGKCNKVITSFQLFEKGKVSIELLEQCKFTTKKDLLKKEQEYILKFDNCVNKVLPVRTKKQYRIDCKDEIKKYREAYYDNHKENILKKTHDYYIKNKDKIRAYKNEKIKCSCGGTYNRDHKSCHMKSIKHKTFLENNN